MYRERTIILGRVLLMLCVCSREQKKCEERTKERTKEAKERKSRDEKQQRQREALPEKKRSKKQKTRQKFTLFLSRPIGGVGVLQ